MCFIFLRFGSIFALILPSAFRSIHSYSASGCNSVFSILECAMKRYKVFLIIFFTTIGIATAAFALPHTAFIGKPFPESASLLILGSCLICLANFVRRNILP